MLKKSYANDSVRGRERAREKEKLIDREREKKKERKRKKSQRAITKGSPPKMLIKLAHVNELVNYSFIIGRQCRI